METILFATGAWVCPFTQRLVSFDSCSSSSIEIAEPTDDATALLFEDAGEALACREALRRLARLDVELQVVDKACDGTPNLTAVLDFDQFEQLVADAQGSAIGEQLKQAHAAWLGAGVDLVYFDFSALEKEEEATAPTG